MAFFFGEMISTLAAAVILLLLLSGSGAFFAKTLAFPGLGSTSAPQRLGIGLLCGIACLPVLLDLAGHIGPLAMLGLALGTWLCGVPMLAVDVSRIKGRTFGIGAALFAIWALFAGFMVVDLPADHGRLLHSYLVTDYVKHTSATWSIAQSGTPPWNPAAYVPGGHAVYYYFFYCLTAVTSLIGAPLGLEARHAAFAAPAVIGVALFAMACLAWQRSGLDFKSDNPSKNFFARQRPEVVLGILLCATGLDLLPVLWLVAATGGMVPTDVEQWNAQVTSWISSCLWVPHHTSALCTALIGFIALSSSKDETAPPCWRNVILAGVAFASMAGMSVYVGIGGALSTVIWAVTLLLRGRMQTAFRVAIAGVFALCLATPWIVSLVPAVGSGGPPPIDFRLRVFKLSDVLIESDSLRSLARLLLLPLSYMIEFGVFALGTFRFWKELRHRAFPTELARLLLISTLVALVIGSFLSSTIVNNDLGWRIVLFAQFGTLIWTMSALRYDFSPATEFGKTILLCLALSYGFNLLAFFQLRFNAGSTYIQSAFLPDEIAAWQWLDNTLPKGSVVQQRPDALRVIGFALYGHFPMAQADSENARLYGASASLVDARMNQLIPIFEDKSLTAADVMSRCAAYNIKALIVSSDDAVFNDQSAWPHQLTPAFANDHVKVFLIAQAHS